MSIERQEWISAFLSLFHPIITDCGYQTNQVILDASRKFEDYYNEPDTLFIGHEVSKCHAKYLTSSGVTFIDIRISPIRFMSHDNILAIGTNSLIAKSILARYAMASSDISIEANALALSLRYRDLGQHQFPSGSLVFFTEQPGGSDSIHHGDDVSLDQYSHELGILAQQYAEKYFVARPNDSEKDIDLLERMGFRRTQTNIYAVLGSSNVKSIGAIRSGILSEAQFFKKEIHRLGETTTLLWDDNQDYNDGQPWFFNISPDDALSISFWKDIFSGSNSKLLRQNVLRRPQDLIRRALNNWNSSALGLNFHTQFWHEMVGNPILDMRHLLQEEVGYRFAQALGTERANNPFLTGRWRWFSGEIVHIEADGHVRSNGDFGHLIEKGNEWAIHWVRRNLIDRLTINHQNDSISIINQYGDGGDGARI